MTIVPKGVLLVRYAHERGDIFAWRDGETGDALCWRCLLPLADGDADESPARPVAQVDVEKHGHRVAVCPGCRVRGDA